MHRRVKFILLIIGSVILLAAVFIFIVWPLLKPVLPEGIVQPPSLGTPTPQTYDIERSAEEAPAEEAGEVAEREQPVFTYGTGEVNPDVQRIVELSRQAGVLSERVESGSSANGFRNYSDAALTVSDELAEEFRAKQAEMRERYPADNSVYLTVARRLVEIPESETRIVGDTFTVRVQMQVETQYVGQRSVEYKESTVTFALRGANWIAIDYDVRPFTP